MSIENTRRYRVLKKENQRLEERLILEKGTTDFYRVILAKVLIAYYEDVEPGSKGKKDPAEFKGWKAHLARVIGIPNIP